MTDDPNVNPLLAPVEKLWNPKPVHFRQWIDAEWCDWSVTEVEAAGIPGSRGAHCLLFTRLACIRRVWNYPADWRQLDSAGLAALSWQR
jgi:hypothetical protein